MYLHLDYDDIIYHQSKMKFSVRKLNLFNTKQH